MRLVLAIGIAALLLGGTTVLADPALEQGSRPKVFTGTSAGGTYITSPANEARLLAQAKGRAELTEGEALMASGELQQAEGHIKKAMQLDPDDVFAMWAYARLLSRQGRYKESAALFKKVMAYGNDAHGSQIARDITTGCEYALVLLKLSYWDTACEVWEQTMRYTVSVPEQMIERASRVTHDWSEVIAYQNTHRRLCEERFAPNNLRKKEMEALCQYLLGTQNPSWDHIPQEEKLAHLEAAVKANPKLPEAQLAYGDSLYGARRLPEAKAAFLVAHRIGNDAVKFRANGWLIWLKQIEDGVSKVPEGLGQ